MAEYINKEFMLKNLEADKMNNAEHCEPVTVQIMERFIRYVSEFPAADVQPVNQWISVNDRLPEAVEEDVNGKIAFSELVLVYLVYNNGFTYITTDQCRVDDKSWLHEIPGEGCKVTHWQPLPEPPKDGEQNENN